MTATKIRPVQATAPERVYLQGGPQLPPETEFGALSEVTWCSDDVDGAGIPYVRADLAGAAPAAVARWGCEDRSAWFALAMGAAANLEDAANCLRDKDAQKAAMGAATHVRESCNKLWWSAPALEAPAAPADDRAEFEKWARQQSWIKDCQRYDDGRYGHCETEKAWATWQARAALAAAPQAPAAPSGDEREAFEAWIKKDGGDLSTFGSGQNRHYNNSAVNNAWTGWSSRAAQAAPAAPVGRYKLADDGGHQYLDGIEARYSIEREDGTTVAWVLGNEADAKELMAAIGTAPAAPEGVPAQGDPAALLQLAEVLESGRSLIDIERKEAAHALRLQATAAPAAPAVDATSDTALLDAMERERIAVIPEFEGPWDAQIFGEDEAALACGSGVTPRKAIAEALASLEARKAHDAAQAKEGGDQ